MTTAEMDKLRDMLRALVPKDGSTLPNATVLEQLKTQAKNKLSYQLSDDDYWELRNQLVTQGEIGKGKGKGGTVYRLKAAQRRPKKKSGARREATLYPSFERYLSATWTKDNNIKQYVLQRTATQGKRATGGKWTRPDFAVVAIKLYPYIPGKFLELITFEVKPADQYRIEGVFETAAHSRFSNKSYLAVHLPDGPPQTEEFLRVEKECERFGVGFITFTDPGDPNSYEVVQEAERRTPDPEDVNGFIGSQLTKDNQSRVLELVK